MAAIRHLKSCHLSRPVILIKNGKSHISEVWTYLGTKTNLQNRAYLLLYDPYEFL